MGGMYGQAVGDWTTKVYNKLNFELATLQREDQSIPHDFLPVHVDGPYVLLCSPPPPVFPLGDRIFPLS
jgi:hypothetical protein